MAAQAAHSVEEYATGLYDVFPPARFVAGLVSGDLAFGFAVANAVIVAFGLFCLAFPVRAGWPSARGLAWGWASVELVNGVGHLLFAAARGGYFPGAVTAPLLLVSAAWLVRALAPRSG